MTNSKLGWVGPIGGCWPNLTRTDCWVRPYFFQVSIPISSFSHPRSVSKHWPTTHIFRYESHVQVSVGSPSHGLFSWVPYAGPRDLGPATGRGWKDPPYLIGGDWNMAWFFPSIGNVIIPTDELHHFQRVGIPPTGDYFCGKTWFPANAPWNQASDKQRTTKKTHTPRIGWRTLLWWGLTIYYVPGFGLLFCGGFTNWMLTLYTYKHTIIHMNIWLYIYYIHI